MSLPTVKLTFDEWFALATRAGSLLDPDKIRAAFIAAFGEKRGLGYFNTHDGESWSQRDTWLFVRALAPAIPGDTEDAQIDWIMEHAAPCFATTARFAEVTAFVRDRVDAFKDAGGSLDTYTDADVSPAAKKDIDLAGAIWGGGINGSKAIITQQITSLTFTGSKFFIQTSAGTRTWAPTKDGCNQYAMPGRLQKRRVVCIQIRLAAPEQYRTRSEQRLWQLYGLDPALRRGGLLLPDQSPMHRAHQRRRHHMAMTTQTGGASMSTKTPTATMKKERVFFLSQALGKGSSSTRGCSALHLQGVHRHG